MPYTDPDRQRAAMRPIWARRQRRKAELIRRYREALTVLADAEPPIAADQARELACQALEQDDQPAR